MTSLIVDIPVKGSRHLNQQSLPSRNLSRQRLIIMHLRKMIPNGSRSHRPKLGQKEVVNRRYNLRQTRLHLSLPNLNLLQSRTNLKCRKINLHHNSSQLKQTINQPSQTKTIVTSRGKGTRIISSVKNRSLLLLIRNLLKSPLSKLLQSKKHLPSSTRIQMSNQFQQLKMRGKKLMAKNLSISCSMI